MYMQRSIKKASQASVTTYNPKEPNDDRLSLARSVTMLLGLSVACWAVILYVVTLI